LAQYAKIIIKTIPQKRNKNAFFIKPKKPSKVSLPNIKTIKINRSIIAIIISTNLNIAFYRT